MPVKEKANTMKPCDAHRVTDRDDVAVVVRDVAAGENLTLGSGAEITAVTPIPSGHKIALRDIAAGENVLKYGSVIGAASADIPKGAHVHVHNLGGVRGRGDKARVLGAQ
jgi:altronate dehydratase